MLIISKTTRPISIFFSPKEAQQLFRQLQKLSARNIAALKWESRKTKCWVPWYPPYAVKCKSQMQVAPGALTSYLVGKDSKARTKSTENVKKYQHSHSLYSISWFYLCKIKLDIIHWYFGKQTKQKPCLSKWYKGLKRWFINQLCFQKNKKMGNLAECQKPYTQ